MTLMSSLKQSGLLRKSSSTAFGLSQSVRGTTPIKSNSPITSVNLVTEYLFSATSNLLSTLANASEYVTGPCRDSKMCFLNKLCNGNFETPQKFANELQFVRMKSLNHSVFKLTHLVVQR